VVSLTVILLVTPIDISINSDEEEFIRGRYGLVRIGVKKNSEDFVAVVLSVPFARFTVYPREKKEKKKEPGKTDPERKQRSVRSKLEHIKLLINIVWEVMCKFRIKRFHLDIDTGNVISNAYLFPLFFLAGNKPQMELHINYTNNFCLVFDARNNLLNIIIVIIRNFFKK
jgi:hypothetical protein